MAEKTHKTLGRNVIPENYKLTIDSDIKTFKFNGNVIISVDIKKPTRRITLNSKLLKINKALIISKGKDYAAKVKVDKKDETLLLSFEKAVRGSAKITIDFNGSNNDEMYGLYKSKYSYKGKDGYILSTQFESTDARSAFPCFDEPEFKATFDLALVIDKGLAAVSNMPIKSESKAGSKKKVTFDTTLKMSTYLLYMGIGKFEFLEGKLGKRSVRVVTVPGKIAYAGMALDFTKKFLAYYEDYFGVKYPLPKMDMIAVPDFAAGAMENWGAIAFREVEILGNEKITSVAMKRRIAEVIAHELAHQWFGDLVTMAWWDDLWLNESFATFMAYKAVDHIFPEWQMGTQYFIDTVGTALSMDQLKTTHPISVHVNEPSEINEIFDGISYEKGGSILSMLEDYVGAETFRKGLNLYLRKHEYGNATKYDLWGAIQQVAKSSGKNVSRVASYWIDNPGYPMVDVKLGGNGVLLEQNRFLLADGKGSGTWPIPLHYKTENGQGYMLMSGKTDSISLEKGSYVKLNYLQKGLYRVRYPEMILSELGELLKTKKISALDAWGIENDLYALARSCKIPLKTYLDFIERYCFDCGYPLNFSVSGHLYGLSVLLHGTSQDSRINELIISYHKLILDQTGWQSRDSDDDVTIMLRSVAIRNLGIAGDKDTEDRAKALFKDYIEKGKPIETNIRSAVYAINAWTGDDWAFGKFAELYKNVELPEERSKLLAALGNFGSTALAKKGLSLTLSKYVRLQDSPTIPAVASSNYVGKELIWSWTKANWKTLARRCKAQLMLSSFVGDLGIVGDQKTRDEIKRFYANPKNMKKEIKRELAQTLERIDTNIRFEKLQAN